MRKKIVIQTPGAKPTMFICMLHHEDQERIRHAVIAYVKEYIGEYDINLDNAASASVENAMDGRLCDLEETFELCFRG